LTSGDPPGVCTDCGAGLRPRQRYCLGCGRRIGLRGAQLEELVRRARAWPSPKSPAPRASGGPPAPAGRRGAGGLAAASGRPGALLAGLSKLTLPSRRISALLVLAFAGFGVVLGDLAGSRVDDTLAASSRPGVKLLLASPNGATTQREKGSAAVEPLATPSQATPEAAPEAPEAPEAAHAPPPAAAHGSPPASRHANPPGEGGSAPASAAPAAKLPAIKHVFVIMLSNQPYAATFGPQSSAPYLSRKLEKRGALLARYYAVAHGQLANGIALLSGQGPTPATAANCPVYLDVSPATVGGEEQVAGDGCVYPATTATLPGQLEIKRLTWRAYLQGAGEPGATAPACGHPAIGQPDASTAQPAGQPYATFRNPFVYFRGLVEDPSCAKDDVGLSSLSTDLSDAKRTPNLSYIVPDRCHDGSPGPCPGGGPGGLAAADGLLAQVVPKILASTTYRRGGLLLITTDAAPSSGEFADSSSCCGQPRFPNLPPATGVSAGLPPEGGGQVGALALSPFIRPRTTSQEPYNHYALLRTIEDLFAVRHLGYAAGAHVSSLQPSLFAGKPSPSR
jgi:phosphatidylinositol-3-phosphatase